MYIYYVHSGISSWLIKLVCLAAGMIRICTTALSGIAVFSTRTPLEAQRISAITVGFRVALVIGRQNRQIEWRSPAVATFVGEFCESEFLY